MDRPNLFENMESVEGSRGQILTEYLEKVLGSDVALGNFTPTQIRAIIKLMYIDKVYYSQFEKLNITNIPRRIVEIVVESSKGKEGLGLEAMKTVFRERFEEEKREETEDKAIRRR